MVAPASETRSTDHRVRAVYRAPVAWLVVALVVLFGWLGVGLVSSNDGSHVALGRALVVRGETPIDPDVHLTLLVDRARRGDHQYSDRPPGTAFAALPAMRIGAWLDGVLWAKSAETQRVAIVPATEYFLNTHAKRIPDSAALLAGLQGTALTARLQAALVGGLGLGLVAWWLRRRGASTGAQSFAVLTLGVATLWGPYSTMLFSHVTAGTLLVATLVASDVGRHARVEVGGARSKARPRWSDVVVGACGAWAVASDYLLVMAVGPLIMGVVPWRRWGAVALGATPVAVATLAYHDAAFGSPWSIGYHWHANFRFARSMGETFSGDPLSGMWTLWGLGHGAGVLAQAPIVFVGVWAVVRHLDRRLWLALIPWIAMLAFHKTPWGGGTQDHRYLVPMLPLAGFGLGLQWDVAGRATHGRTLRLTLVLVAVVSSALVWSHFIRWRGF